MPVRRVKELLDREGIEYRTIRHAPAFTAMEEAAASHIPGAAWAKTVVFFDHDRPGLAVLPATYHVNQERLARLSQADSARLATEEETVRLFPECEAGAMPPFGLLWDVPVYADESITAVDRVAFHAGSHAEAVEMATSDFIRLADPEVGDFADRDRPQA